MVTHQPSFSPPSPTPEPLRGAARPLPLFPLSELAGPSRRSRSMTREGARERERAPDRFADEAGGAGGEEEEQQQQQEEETHRSLLVALSLLVLVVGGLLWVGRRTRK
ncbi:uncharacterized protein AB675_10738 [Cyphellophora attinorum]|uniref:Uncharacterized protein n=1 Tax=Cyphellophora attinorum TaxID=1664694 RepID=A0A0N1HA78_9EURO|nr:uncharacterized protein AB675_10738 [Phialophora attinorum]KPI40682.1 hypothetical protein AB675_10738 [Phialophora attinorum]